MKKSFNLNYLVFSLLVLFRLISLFWPLIADQLVHYRVVQFSQLPGWKNADLVPSFKTFQASCRVMLKRDPESLSEHRLFSLKAKAWFPACKKALEMHHPSTPELKSYFETYFSPVQFKRFFPLKGLFTGYYLPELTGSLKKSSEFSVPIYGIKNHSDDLVVMAWVHSEFDRRVLQIEGSGSIRVEPNRVIYVGFAGLLNHFVYFKEREPNLAKGAQGINLTPGHSMAVDKSWVPLGTPLWLSTRIPSSSDPHVQPIKRMMVAQDTGYAILGPVRGDFFFGEGKEATHLAKQMYYRGKYWLLLPKLIRYHP